MNAPPAPLILKDALTLALSLSSSFTKVGALAAFVALVGIAILSLLVFSQAREIKRLRDWAGRAPERAAELEQRVSAAAAARMADRRSQGSSITGPAPPAPQGRVVPRTTPLVSAPVSTAVSASASAVALGRAPGGAEPAAGVQSQAASQPSTALTGQASAASLPGTPADQASAASSPAAAAAQPVGSQAGEPSPPPAESAAAPAQPVAAPASTPAPATAAAQSAGRPARTPLPPSPAAPKPAAPRSTAIPAAQAVSSQAASSRPRASAAPVGSAATAGAPVAGGSGRKDFRQERSPARAIVLGVGVLIVVVLLLIFAVSALKGGSSAPTATRSAASEATTSTGRGATTRHGTGHRAAANPAETAVVVLNGTATNGLAHHLASDLQQSGYTHALASAAVPPGTHQTTVVEYSGGHRADAQAVARALNVTQVQSMDPTTSGLAGSAAVVVLAGADQAAQLGGGGAQSQGEPAAGQ